MEVGTAGMKATQECVLVTLYVLLAGILSTSSLGRAVHLVSLCGPSHIDSL